MPLFGNSLTAAKGNLLCHIIESETLVCFPRFPLRTLLLFGDCSSPRRLYLVLFFRRAEFIAPYGWFIIQNLP